MLWQRAKTVGIVFHIAKLRTKFETNKFFTRKSCELLYFSSSPTRLSLLLIGEKRFAYRWKTFCSSMKKERGTSFLRQPKTGTNVTSKFSSSSSSFLSTFSLTPIGVLFVCSFVCLRAREETRVKCSFASLCNTFFDTQKVQFLQHNLHTVFAHNFCTILRTFLIQFWLHFWCKLECFFVQHSGSITQKDDNKQILIFSFSECFNQTNITI